MSHNSKYYVKKLSKKDGKGLQKIGDVFKKINKVNKVTDESSEIKSEVAKAIEYIIKEVCKTNETNDSYHGNVDNVNDQSTIEKVSAPTALSETSTAVSVCESVSPVETESVKIDQRKFSSQKYEHKYTWLYFSHSKNGFMCKICELFALSSSSTRAFVYKGVILGTHPTRQLESHAESVCHQSSVERYSFSKSNVNVSRQLRVQDAKAKDQNRSVVKKLFQCVDFLIKQKWAASKNTEKLVRFIATLGVKDLEQHISSSEVKYLSQDCVMQMVLCISDLIERKLIAGLQGKEFALLADESADIAHRSQLSIMARFQVNDEEGVKTHFLGFAQLGRMTAEAIMNVIETFLLAKGVLMEKIRFMGFDGCNTMSGERTGLQRRIRHVSPFAVYINCRNHRLALCLAHLIKQFEILKDVDSALLSLWKMFEYSPQKMAVFKNIQTVYGNEPLAVIKAAATRWLSHLHASARFVSRYVCILDTLDAIYADKKEPEIYGLRLILTNKTVVATILLLCDILKPLNLLSLYLQAENINFTSLPQHVRATADSLTGLVEIYEQNMDNLVDSDTEFAKCEQLFAEITDRTVLGRRMRMGPDPELTPQEYLTKTGIPLIYSLVQEVQDAFSTGEPVLTGFSFLHPENLPQTIPELREYGQTEITRLVNFYGSPKEDKFKGHTINTPGLVDPVDLETQLKSFKVQLFMLRQSLK